MKENRKGQTLSDSFWGTYGESGSWICTDLRAVCFRVPLHAATLCFSRWAAGVSLVGSVHLPRGGLCSGRVQASPSAGPAGRLMPPLCQLCSDPECPGLAATGMGSPGAWLVTPPGKLSLRKGEAGTPPFALPVSGPLLT